MKHVKLLVSASVLSVALAGGYLAFDSYTGNKVEIKEVISAAASASAKSSSGQQLTNEAMSGMWNVAPSSEVYFSVTTSKSTVNFVAKEVVGSWTLDAAEPAKSTAEGSIAMKSINSGNADRDDHVRAKDYFDVASFPNAVFKAKSFSGLPQSWTEGEKVSFQMVGTLSVKGIEKEVTFNSDALVENGQLKLEGKTVVTFADFGLKNPHNVLMETQNNIDVQLRLVLEKAGS
ncbi:YceI family protein [Paenibacillus sp. YYML68]|uniref:YceI family protein n=1 Tax=Paenibacillus sp. YYML68 TaxID=2909250 RepID=UPI00248FED3F|nr:YceI family protein [Paenibacillus sp. YYML68]